MGHDPMDSSTNQSPLPSPRPLLRPFELGSLATLPAAAEAKLEVNGEGILHVLSYSEFGFGWFWLVSTSA